MKVQILISVPHSSTEFPSELHSIIKPEILKQPLDTDWFVDQLYDFTDELGITLIKADYSRYVIDLNRDPKSIALYNDGRKETTLCPTQSFSGKSLYRNGGLETNEIKRRLHEYYWPYYRLIEEKLSELKKMNGQVLFFDAHSIKRNVKSIQDEDFPDLILGTAEEKSASKNIINCALSSLKKGHLEVSHNTPFKGGHLTRYFGNPAEGVHALQLEMSQDIYMNEETLCLDEVKASKVKVMLKKMFKDLITEIRTESNL